jgi:hypothetical protein
MQKEDVFKSQKKLRHAEVIRPPNLLKMKVGSGDLPKEVIEKAQETLDNTTIDFRPIAWALIKELSAAAQVLRGSISQDENDIELLLFPAMQLQTQGAMLKFKPVADIADVLVHFLETVTGISADVLSVVDAHLTALNYTLKTPPEQIKPDNVKMIVQGLVDACARYYKQHGKME